MLKLHVEFVLPLLLDPIFRLGADISEISLTEREQERVIAGKRELENLFEVRL